MIINYNFQPSVWPHRQYWLLLIKQKLKEKLFFLSDTYCHTAVGNKRKWWLEW